MNWIWKMLLVIFSISTRARKTKPFISNALECPDWKGKEGVPNFRNEQRNRDNRRFMIVSGGIADTNEYPWVAKIDMCGQNTCTGSVVSREYILTAAHCYNSGCDPSGGQLKVLLAHGTVTVTAREWRSHPEYKGEYHTTTPDIALLRVDPIPCNNENIRPVALLESNNGFNFDSCTAFVQGFGQMNEAEDGAKPEFPDTGILNELVTKVYKGSNRAKCGEPFDDVSKKTYSTDIYICSTSETNTGEQICKGDSGDPLTLDMDTSEGHRYIQLGITAFNRIGIKKSGPFGWKKRAIQCHSGYGGSWYTSISSPTVQKFLRTAKIDKCNWKCYLNRYPNVKNSWFGSSLKRAETHYEQYGFKEGKDCTCGGTYHLAPPGATKCDRGHSVSQNLCDSVARSLHFKTPARELQVGGGGSCRDGGWGQVPLGCSVQSGGDYAAHYKTHGTQEKSCVHAHYQLVCFDDSADASVGIDRCWELKDGFYVLEGHMETDLCFDTLEEAKAECQKRADCGAISSQNNVCGGKFRIAIGGPTFIDWREYNSEETNLRSWRKKCELPPVFVCPNTSGRKRTGGNDGTSSCQRYCAENINHEATGKPVCKGATWKNGESANCETVGMSPNMIKQKGGGIDCCCAPEEHNLYYQGNSRCYENWASDYFVNHFVATEVQCRQRCISNSKCNGISWAANYSICVLCTGSMTKTRDDPNKVWKLWDKSPVANRRIPIVWKGTSYCEKKNHFEGLIAAKCSSRFSDLQCYDLLNGQGFLKPDGRCRGNTCTDKELRSCCTNSVKPTCLKKNDCCIGGTSCDGCPGGYEASEFTNQCKSSRGNGRPRRCGKHGKCLKRPGECCTAGHLDCFGCPWGSEYSGRKKTWPCGGYMRCKFAP